MHANGVAWKCHCQPTVVARIVKSHSSCWTHNPRTLFWAGNCGTARALERTSRRYTQEKMKAMSDTVTKVHFSGQESFVYHSGSGASMTQQVGKKGACFKRGSGFHLIKKCPHPVNYCRTAASCTGSLCPTTRAKLCTSFWEICTKSWMSQCLSRQWWKWYAGWLWHIRQSAHKWRGSPTNWAFQLRWWCWARKGRSVLRAR